MTPDRRAEVLASVAELVSPAGDGVFVVGVDGPDAAGKTHFADELAGVLERIAPVIRVTIDRFHNPALVRHARDEAAPAESFYEDSFDLDAFEKEVVAPLGGPAPRVITPGVFDVVRDEPHVLPQVEVASGTVVVFDGIFLGRDRLRGFLDLWVYLDVSEDVSMRRGVARDAPQEDGQDRTRDRHRRRYLAGQRLYRTRVDPHRHADVVIDNEDLVRPRLVRVPSTD